MLPVEGTDVHVSRCNSISSGEKNPNLKSINTRVSSVLQEGSKVPFPAHSSQWLGSKKGRPGVVFLTEKSLLQWHEQGIKVAEFSRMWTCIRGALGKEILHRLGILRLVGTAWNGLLESKQQGIFFFVCLFLVLGVFELICYRFM